MIKFLKEYETKAHPPEKFLAGQVVSGRDEASERHFVSRRIAGYVDEEGKLTDIDGTPIQGPATIEVPDEEKPATGPDAVMTSATARPRRAAS